MIIQPNTPTEIATIHPTQAGHPAQAAAAYLATLAPVGRKGMVSALNTIAAIVRGLTEGELAAMDKAERATLWQSIDWRTLSASNAGIIRAKLTGAPASINKTIAGLRGVAKQLWLMRAIDGDERGRIEVATKLAKGTRLQAGRAMEDWELAALMRGCSDSTDRACARDACAIAIAAKTGCRRAELASIKLADITTHPAHVEIRVIGKGDKERILHVDNGALKALNAWLAVRGADGAYLFVAIDRHGNINTGKGMSTTAFDAMLIKRCAAAGVSNLDWHDLRRTVATRLLDAGADLVVVRDVLGHKSMDTTARYDHRGEDAKRRAVEKISIPYFGK